MTAMPGCSHLLLNSDALKALGGLEEESVDCVVTSPPYWGLRDYKLVPLVWGGHVGCKHKWVVENVERENRTGLGLASSLTSIRGGGHKAARVGWQRFEMGACPLCGAWRGSLGLEPTPEMYVQHLCMVMREVKHVLKRTGTLWLNLGDSYANDRKWGGKSGAKNYTSEAGGYPRRKMATGLKPKELVGIPWRVAFALQRQGWYLRADIIWHKPNPLPESVRDRPTKAHEYLFLFSRSERYHYNAEAIKESASDHGRMNGREGRQ